jgi:uncharacterized cupredoxin-like copper-binding protein
MAATDFSTPDHHLTSPKGTPMQYSKRTLLIAASAALLGATTIVRAHGDKPHASKGAAKKEQKEWGIAGDAKAVTRTVEVRMLDTMRFVPNRVDVRQGETIRFVHRNDGKVMHEFVIGTKKENEAHAALMMKFPTMEHDEPYMAHVPPGKTAEIIWTFNRSGEFEFACLIPGHYAAGMAGTVAVRTA